MLLLLLLLLFGAAHTFRQNLLFYLLPDMVSSRYIPNYLNFILLISFPQESKLLYCISSYSLRYLCVLKKLFSFFSNINFIEITYIIFNLYQLAHRFSTFIHINSYCFCSHYDYRSAWITRSIYVLQLNCIFSMWMDALKVPLPLSFACYIGIYTQLFSYKQIDLNLSLILTEKTWSKYFVERWSWCSWLTKSCRLGCLAV